MMRYDHFIAGQWVRPAVSKWFDTLDPSTGQVLAQLAFGSEEDVNRAVAAARAAQQMWASVDAVRRGRILARISAGILSRLEKFAELESRDTGKPLSQARVDVSVAARYFEFYAGLADKFGGTTIPVPGPFLDYTLREPVGVVGVIIPWNYPLQIGSRAIAAPLAVGNTVVLKPAEEASVTVLELARLCQDEGVPSGVINVVTGTGEDAGAPLAAHPGIDHLTFTGSLESGRKVAAAAGNNVVPVTLELGGKSPHLVFSSANVDRAIPIIANSFLQNAGQTCSAGSRILVHESRQEELVSRLRIFLRRITMGPGVANPDLGPLVSAKQWNRVQEYLDLAGQEGTEVWTADTPHPDTGYFCQPAILNGVRPESRIFQEEIFGPIASVTPFSSEAEAIILANATEYGLVAAVWSQDIGQAHRVAAKLHCGQVFINSYGAGGGVEMPFGGYGHSGYGREKGIEALYHYTRLKNVAVFLGE